MLKKASAGAAGQYIGGSGGVAGARGWRQDDPNHVLACSKVWAGISALHGCILVLWCICLSCPPILAIVTLFPSS